MSSPSSTLSQYEVVEVIGKGSFGCVSKLRRKADGRVCDMLVDLISLHDIPFVASCVERIGLWYNERKGEATCCVRGNVAK